MSCTCELNRMYLSRCPNSNDSPHTQFTVKNVSKAQTSARCASEAFGAHILTNQVTPQDLNLIVSLLSRRLNTHLISVASSLKRPVVVLIHLISHQLQQPHPLHRSIILPRPMKKTCPLTCGPFETCCCCSLSNLRVAVVEMRKIPLRMGRVMP